LPGCREAYCPAGGEGVAESPSVGRAAALPSERAAAVTGRLDYRKWDADGSERSRHEVIADNVEFLSRPKAEQDQS
jgi:hypothetical protein